MNAGKRIRVLHVGKFYAPVEGGIENVVQELVEGFQGDDEIAGSVLVAQRKGASSVDDVRGTSIQRVRSHGVLLGMPLSPGFPAAIAKAACGFDIVQVHVPNPLPFFCDWSRLRRRGVRLIVHHHSDIVRPLQRALLRGMGNREQSFYRSAQQVLVSSDRLLRHSETLAPHQEKCRVLPLSISLAHCRRVSAAEREATRAQLGVEKTEVVFFFLGRLVYYKGVQELIRAAAGVACRVLIGGCGPLRGELEKITHSLGLADRVTFLGRIDRERLPEIFAAADVFVLPSNASSEAFGVVQLEAMAHGLPVINTSLPTGVPEVSLHGLSGLTVTPGSVSELREAMRLLAADAALRLRYSTAARHRVTQFERGIIQEKLRFLYREVMAMPIEESSASAGLPLRSEGDLQPCSTTSLPICPRPSSSV